jgi:isopropylmalate/homocitrate/citramalate synthase
MISIDDLEQLKREREEMVRVQEQAKGGISQILSRLKTDFDLDSLDRAEKLLKKKERQRIREAEEYNLAYDEYKSELEKRNLEDDDA